MSERLNYKEGRENVFKSLERSNIISKYEIWKALNLNLPNEVSDFNERMRHAKDYYKLSAFLKVTRRYADKMFDKCIDEEEQILKQVLKVIFLKDIDRDERGEKIIDRFLRFCETERIPLLYYIPHIKKYIFPNKQLYRPIHNRLFIISSKILISSLKRAEIFGVYKNIDEMVEFMSQMTKKGDVKEYGNSHQYLITFLRENYIFGEDKEQMFKRLEFDKIMKDLNKEIKDNINNVDN